MKGLFISKGQTLRNEGGWTVKFTGLKERKKKKQQPRSSKKL